MKRDVWKAGFDKKRLFYTQGDYGLFQCREPCCNETFENEGKIPPDDGVAERYGHFLKYPFWQMTAENPKAVYARVNYGEAACPKEIEAQSVCIDGDIGRILHKNVQMHIK